MSVVTFIAPAHVSVLKNCGVNDEYLNNPYTDSISVSLDMEFMCAKATVVASDEFKNYELYVDGRYEGRENTHVRKIINEIKEVSRSYDKSKLLMLLKIYCENNFPKEIGLDYKAAEYAALVAALTRLYKIEGDVSYIARFGYGPACRNLYGGFVRWTTAQADLTYSSHALPIIDARHWPDMRVLILVAAGQTDGGPTRRRGDMSQSDYLKFAAQHVSKKKSAQMWEAIYEKNFQCFAELTMQDSNETQALYLAAYPPIIYMNDLSHAVIEFVHLFNSSVEEIKVGYTFEATPNPILFMLNDTVLPFLRMFYQYFPPAAGKLASEYYKGPNIVNPTWPRGVPFRLDFPKQPPGKIEYIILTRLGEAPKLVSDL